MKLKTMLKRWTARVVYGAVGISAVVSLIWMLTFAGFWDMPMWSIVAIILLIVGGLNWGIVAITGKRSKDLFGLLKL